MNDVSFTEQTLWIELGIIMTTYTLIRWGLSIYRKLDEEERREDDGHNSRNEER